MSAFTPSVHWRWQFEQFAALLLPGHCHQTPFSTAQLTGTALTEFTLEQAQLFDAYWHRLVSLKLPEEACFAAAVDALCCQQFMPQSGHKSWAFTTISTDYQPQLADLVFIQAKQTLLALVVQSYAGSSQLLMLDNGYNLQEKPVYAGQVLVLLNNRMQPAVLCKNSTTHFLAKSA